MQRPRHVALGKLSAPRLGRVFERQRLFAELDHHAHAPGLWVAAPPGAGKSTLLATWLGRQARPACWLRVDPDDADPGTFVRSFDALATGLLADGAAVPELPPFRGDDLADLPAWLRRRLRHLLPLLPDRWTLVFDNHQELPAAAPLHAALSAALGELPDGVQWVFASREPPPAAYASQLAARQLALVDAATLRFDAAETEQLVALHGHDPAMVEPLAAAQGWAAGMTLMLLGQPRGAAPSMAHAARQRLFDYFADEVLSRMDALEQRLLGAIAFLPRTTAELAVAMSESPAAAALLERLAAAGLFTDRRDETPPVYELHALFNEFLRRRVERLASADELRALQLRSARLLLAAGDTDGGLQRLAEGQAWDEAEAALRRAAPRYAGEGRLLALRRHIDALPTEQRSRLAYWHGLSGIDHDPVQALADLAQAQSLAAAAGDARAELEAGAAAATALLASGRLAELDPWIELLDRHAEVAREPCPPEAELRLVPGFFAALIHRQPWHPMTENFAPRAERLLHHDGAAEQRLLLGALAFRFLWHGDLERLHALARRIDALCTSGLAAPVTLMRWWGTGVLVKSLFGQIDSARADVSQALGLVQADPSLARQRAHAYLLAMMVAICARDPSAVRHHLQQAAHHLHPERPLDRSFYEHERAMLALLEDDAAAALDLMLTAVASGRASGFAVREHIALIGYALAASLSGQHALAQAQLAQMRAHPLWPRCRWHHWIGGCVAAYAALVRGDLDAAAAELRGAFVTARACGYRHSPMLLCARDVMPSLVALASERGIEPELARELVQLHRLEAPAGAGAHWPWAVQIRVLGRLGVQLDGQALPAPRKESKRLMELLALLAAQGSEPLALDDAADALWPEADGDAARNALDNALHRLRKLLGGDERVLLRQGALLLNPRCCWSDVLSLQALLRRVDAAPSAQLPALLDALRRAIETPLLPDQTLPAIAARRAALERQLQRALRATEARLGAAGS